MQKYEKSAIIRVQFMSAKK